MVDNEISPPSFFLILFFFFRPAMLSTPLVTNCVLRLLVSVPADGPPISPLLTFSAPL